MSVPVAMDELARRVAEYGHHPFLVTTGVEGKAHVVSIGATVEGDELTVQAGRTSRANVVANEAVTLLWPGTGGPYGLIVDGTGRVVGETVVVTPTRAVLHRLADADEALPSCVRIEAAH